MAKSSNRYHIISRNSGWAIKREGASKAAGVFHTKNDAEKEAKRFQIQNNDIVIHNTDGTISAWHHGQNDKK